MDGRHDFILSTVADRLNMTLQDAEEFMLDNEQVSWLLLKLVIYY